MANLIFMLNYTSNLQLPTSVLHGMSFNNQRPRIGMENNHYNKFVESPNPYDEVAAFNSYKLKFSKRYKTNEEHERRRGYFSKNYRRFLDQNDRYAKKKSRWRARLLNFSDLSDEEFAQGHMGTR